jgi:hypothetical protein
MPHQLGFWNKRKSAHPVVCNTSGISSGQVKVGAGDTATVRPKAWQNLDSTTADSQVVGSDGSVSQQAVISNVGQPTKIPSITVVVKAASYKPMALAPGQSVSSTSGIRFTQVASTIYHLLHQICCQPVPAVLRGGNGTTRLVTVSPRVARHRH